MEPRTTSARCRQWGDPPLQQERLARAVRLGLLWTLYAIAAALLESRQPPSICPWRLLTGHRCPFCGMTTAIGKLSRGRLKDAQRAHPLGIFLFAAAGGWIARELIAATKSDAPKHDAA